MAGRKTTVMAALAGVLGILLCFPTDAYAWYRINQVLDYEYRPISFASTLYTLGYTWHDAEAFCMVFGGHLISFESSGEEGYWNSYHWRAEAFSVSAYMWIGMNRLEDDSRWKWSDNSSDIRGFGSKLKLGLGDRNKKCAAQLIVRSNIGKKYITPKTVMLNCDMDARLFVCKRKINDITPKTKPAPIKLNGTCPDGWRDAGTPRCYKTYEHSTGLDWKTAEATCLSLPYNRPNLACVTTAEEANLWARMVTLRTPARFWFGLFRESVDGRWMWADNTEVKHLHLHRFFQSNFDYGGGVVDNRATPKGSWDVASSIDGLRSQVKRYICQVEKTD